MLTSNEARQSAVELARAAGQLQAAAAALATWDENNPDITFVSMVNAAITAMSQAHSAFAARAAS